MKRILFILVFIFPFLGQTQVLREINQPASLTWKSKSVACYTLCISGECDKSENCDAYAALHEAFVDINLERNFYIKDDKFFMKASFKKILLGESIGGRAMRVLTDNEDRLFFSLTEKPALLVNQQSLQREIRKVNSLPISLVDLETAGDLLLGKIPENFPAEFEVGIEHAAYCKKIACNVWTADHLTSGFKKQIYLSSYPSIPLLIDTLSTSGQEVFQPSKTLRFKFQNQKGKTGFTTDEIRAMMSSFYEPTFKINKIKVTAFPDVMGDTVASRKVQRMLSESLVGKLKETNEGRNSSSIIDLGSGWVKFKSLVSNSGLWKYTNDGMSAFRKKVNEDPSLQPKVAAFTNELLTIQLELDVTFQVKNENDYWLKRMELAMNENNNQKALLFQKPLMQLFIRKKCKSSELVPISITPNPENLMLFNNRYAMETNDSIKFAALQLLFQQDENNPVVKYNLLALRINSIKSQTIQEFDMAMMDLLDAYEGINAMSVPASLYAILKSRFYYYYMYGRKDVRLISYKDISVINKKIPVMESLKLSDQLARLGRYDLAVNVINDKETNDSLFLFDKTIRLIFYQIFAGQKIQDSLKITYCDALYSIDKSSFKQYFINKILPYEWLTLPEIRNKIEE